MSILLLLLVSLAPATALAATWHVDPAGTGDFPTIQAAIDGAADGDIISLASGTFAGPGNRDLLIAGRNLTIRSQANDPELCVIDCLETGVPHRGLDIDGGTVRLYAVTIRHGVADEGGAIRVVSGAPIVIDCVLRDSEVTGSGAAVFAAAGADPRFENCRFADNTADVHGGAVRLESGSEAEFLSCVFEDNVALTSGGAVAALASDAAFTDCEFADNSAVTSGGAVFAFGSDTAAFDGCVFRHNGADRGGAVAADGGASPSFATSIFHGNAGDVAGGAFYCDADAEPGLVHCTLIYNDSPDGAGLFSNSYALPLLTNTLIAFNHGAAFGSDGIATAVFHCCDLFGNWDGDWTGGIEAQLAMNGNLCLDPYLNDPAPTELYLTPDSPCLPGNNQGCGQIGARGAGGSRPAYHVDAAQDAMLPSIQAALDLAPDGAIIMLHGAFTGAGNRDLAIPAKSLEIDGTSPQHTVIDCQGSAAEPHRAMEFGAMPDSVDVALRNLTIRNGHEDRGGALLIGGADPLVQNVRFEDCHSEQYGGAIHGIHFNSTYETTIQDCVFLNNVAEEDDHGRGGAIAVLHVFGWRIENCEFTGNAGNRGGALYLASADDIQVTGCAFAGNEATAGLDGHGGAIFIASDAVSLTGCTFDANLARAGGGLYLDTSIVTVTDCEFTTCHADSAGGAIAGNHLADVTAAGCGFLRNDATRGGALAIADDAIAACENTWFEQNTAVWAGGAVHQDGGTRTVQFDSCDFTANQVSAGGGRGGALWLGSGAYLVDCELGGNVIAAAGRGGGLYAAPAAAVELEMCTLQDNSAQFGGGFHALGATLSLDSCWILDNQAVYAAAGYLDEDAGSLIAWTTIAGNTSASTGGGLLCDHASAPELRNCTLVDNAAGTYGAHLVCWNDSQPVVIRSILALAPSGAAVGIGAGGGAPLLECSDIWGNAGGDWVGAIADQLHDDGNFAADPRFCDLAAGDLTLFDTSDCLPENGVCGQLTGAWTQGCIDDGTPVPDAMPAALALEPNVPNPFNPSTVVAFSLPTALPVELAVYDACGRCVRHLARGEIRAAGRHELRWNGTDDAGRQLGSGVYLLRLVAGGEQRTSKAVLMK